MKKISALMAIILAMSISLSANAQQGSISGMQQMFRQRMIDSLQFTPSLADSVIAVQQQFMPQMRAIRMNDSLTTADKMQQFSIIQDQQKTRLSKFLTADQIQKLQAMQQAMRAHPMPMMRMSNSATPPGGGN